MPAARPAPADAVRPLRTRVLRPDWPPGRTLTFEQDDQSETVHITAERDGTVVGVGTVYPEAPPASLREAPGSDVAWQLRGMATSDAVRGAGYGAAVLDACVEAVEARGGRLLWCNARLGAVPFYARAGWVTVGDAFEVAGVGPHVVMWRGV